MSEENVTETTETASVETAESQNANEATETDKDWEAEAAKWKALSRKHEERAKANADAAAELEKVRNESKTDAEKAIESARAEGRTEALKEVTNRLVDAEFRIAAAGKPVNIDALMDGLDRSRFVNDENEVDTEKVVKFIEGLTPAQKANLGQGARGNSTKKSTADLFAESLDF